MFRMTRPAVAGLLLAAAVAACAKKDETVASADTAKPADTTAAAAAMTTAPTPAPSKWTAGTLLGYKWAADNGEVALGKLGATKATNAEVKAFAKEMVADHSKALTGDKALAAKLKATPDTTADDVKDLIGHGNDEIKDLTDKAKGADWDKNFMDKMVEDHQKILDKLNSAAKDNTDPDVTKALTDASGHVQEHLTKAQAIRAKLP
jgi:putative membrane protein